MDNSPGNSGTGRDTDVDLLADSSFSGGFALYDTEAGEYTQYQIMVARSGLYRIHYQARGTGAWTLSSEGKVLAENSAGGSSDWQTLSSAPVYLTDGLQTLRLSFTAAGAELDYLELSYDEPLTHDPHSAVDNMGIGINLGNTLDAYPNEGDWAPAAQQVYFKAFKEAGFAHVRIPATWDDHTAETPPYAVDEARMDRTEQIVDWALAQGYFVMLNAHHEIWLKEDYQSPATRERFDAIWQQISERFANKSARLVLEILNEPVGMSMEQVNDLNPRILGIIREHNPDRLVVISSNDYTPVSGLAGIDLPADEQLIGNFHSYDPWAFAGQCTRRWGSDADKEELRAIYQTASNWASTQGLPVMVNEFGAAHYDYNQPENVCNPDDRLAYLREHVNLATEFGVAASVWDDAGSFGIYNRAEDTWGPAKDILVAPNAR
ncbi:cellulase family glycosylhydrolase [Gilvimarinus algae]|uniref:Cellulase family glycosylhydrolase n=1 Tax=Gilvimarinus algae TaxID=3058037 RepID=A0ABT8TE44_9GAMM|nr:cellulase family glycosylhydrolase [Gilvimarinus sp. SDUM040014]MDO3380936.1 cellulase family glycosylhydrolase [Gilvimarinus sp. SDUM040014]